MQPTSHLPNDSASFHTQSDATVPSTSNLTITMITQTKPKQHAKKYRTIERTDDVITENPRYESVGSSPIPDLQSKKHFFSMEEVPRAGSKKGRPNTLAVGEDVLISIGARLEYTGRYEYNDP
jgi:hypothetical protein